MNSYHNHELLVITPTLGRRASLHRTIQSVRKYGEHSVHVIVGPQDLRKNLLTLYPWIDFLEDDSRLGIFHAVNIGLQAYPNYEFFSFINDDDYWLPGFSTLIKFARANPALSFVYGKTVFSMHQYSRFKSGSFSPFYRHFPALLQFGIPIFTHQSLIVRRHYLKLLGDQFDLAYPLSADSQMWARFVHHSFPGKGLNVFASVYSLDPGRLSLDRQLLTKDHAQRSSSISIDSEPFFVSLLRVLLYRLINVPCYLSRMLQFDQLTSIFLRRHHAFLYDESAL
jgi:hypothetical protein